MMGSMPSANPNFSPSWSTRNSSAKEIVEVDEEEDLDDAEYEKIEVS